MLLSGSAGRNRWWTAALLAALVLSLLVPEAAGAAKKKKSQGKIAGTVINQGGEILVGVAVTLSSPGWNGEDVTDKKGEFSIDVPDPGDYLLRLERQGYAAFEAPVNLATGEKQSVNIEMLDESTGRRNEAARAYNAGAAAFRAKDLVTAKEHFLAATKADPSLPEPYLVLTDIYLGEGAHQEAADAAEKFLTLKPGDRQAQALAYEAYQKLGDQAKVDELRAILGATDLAPQLAIQVYNEGAVADQEGDSETALTKFLEAVELDPDLAAAYAGLATVYFNRERYQDALAAVEKLLAIKPDDGQGHRVRFLILDALGDEAAADEAMSSYLGIDPKGGADLLYRRADRDFRGGNPGLAKVSLVRILKIEPEMARAHYTLGLIYASTDTAKARVHLEKFIELAPEDSEVGSAKEMLKYF